MKNLPPAIFQVFLGQVRLRQIQVRLFLEKTGKMLGGDSSYDPRLPSSATHSCHVAQIRLSCRTCWSVLSNSLIKYLPPPLNCPPAQVPTSPNPHPQAISLNPQLSTSTLSTSTPPSSPPPVQAVCIIVERENSQPNIINHLNSRPDDSLIKQVKWQHDITSTHTHTADFRQNLLSVQHQDSFSVYLLISLSLHHIYFNYYKLAYISSERERERVSHLMFPSSPPRQERERESESPILLLY